MHPRRRRVAQESPGTGRPYQQQPRRQFFRPEAPDRRTHGRAHYRRTGAYLARRSTPDRTRLSPLELSFTPVDNQRLANLCGTLDENLKQIESAFDVSIARRGEHFSISGAPEPSRLAAEALQRFYEQAGRNLGLEEIQLGLIEITGAAARVSGEDALVLQT